MLVRVTTIGSRHFIALTRLCEINIHNRSVETDLHGTFIVNIQVESTLSTDRHRVRALFSVRTDEAGV